MPKLTTRNPKYRLHRASGQAIVTIAGKDHYLGTFNSQESLAAYHRKIAEWIGSGKPGYLPSKPDPLGVPIMLLLRDFLAWAKSNYIKNGRQTGEAGNFLAVAKILRELYGREPAHEFNPTKLRAVREKMIAAKRSRKSINRQIHRVRFIWKWAISHPDRYKLDPAILHALQTVEPLRAGRREDVSETAKVKPVAKTVVDATIQHLPPMVRDMVLLQLRTACRAGELLQMRWADIDRSQTPWVYVPREHKNQHHDEPREIFLGPECRKILEKYLNVEADRPIFSPKVSEKHRREQAHDERKTPLNQGNTPGSNKRRRRRRAPGEAYTTHSYRRAIDRACKLAGVAKWHPHQLRHSRADEAKRKYGPDVALAVLGDSTSSMLNVYTTRDRPAAIKVAEETG